LFHPVSVKDELHSIRDQPECKKCKSFIDYLKRQYKETKTKYNSMKFEREDFIKKIKVLKAEVSLLEAQVQDLRHEVEIYRIEPSQEYRQELLSSQFSEESMSRLERGRPKPLKSCRFGNKSFHN